MKTNVHLFFRKPRAANFSIEGLFQSILAKLPEDICANRVECPKLSSGLFRRIANLWHARHNQATVNHITGDVHYLAMGLDPRRTILTVHDAALLDRLSGWRRRIYKFFWFDWPFRNVALVSVISNATREHLLANTNVPPELVHVVPDCISDEFVYREKEFNATKPRILQIGTKKNKNLERVAEALSGLSCELRLIGPMNDAHRELLETAGIEYTNAFNLTEAELVQEYVDCDMLIFASTIEGFGMPIIEAQKTGRVVVTSNCSSMPEVAGEGAYLVDPLSVASIRAGIVKVIDDDGLRASLIEVGQRNAEQYAPARIAEEYAKLYRRVAGSLNTNS